jgi:D-glycero-D-manno-heptose 1,7-bisphosphate phosphatase
MNSAIAVKDMKRVPILFLDLDGTVRKGYDELGRFVNIPEDVEVFPHMAERLLAWRQKGYRIVGVTNQGGIATGQCTYENAAAAVYRTQVLCHQTFDRIFMCQHHPAAHDPEMANCFCRKPKMGMLVMAQEELSREHPDEIYPPHLMLMVGDRPEDEQCAINAGVAFKWAADWRAEPFKITL